MRRLFIFVALLLVLTWSVAAVLAQNGEVFVLEIEGPVTPAMANYFDRGIDTAERENAAAVLIILDTPGGAVDTTLKIVQSFRTAG
ncbi:MAG TPA: nodulation protein NfeD, partial [Anaerolineae bacterium]